MGGKLRHPSGVTPNGIDLFYLFGVELEAAEEIVDG